MYVLQGWVEFEYEDVGQVRLEKGSSVLQPPGIRHREVTHSADLELLEITNPAEFVTTAAERGGGRLNLRRRGGTLLLRRVFLVGFRQAGVHRVPAAN